MKADWENLGKRMIAANQLGLRIEQDSGHRWLFVYDDSDFVPACLKNNAVRSKQYGSYQSVLDEVDAKLKENGERTLLEVFGDMNYFDDLGIVFGEGVQ